MKRTLLFDKRNQTFLFLVFFIFFYSLLYSQNPPTCSGRWGPPIVNQTFGQGNNTARWYGPLAAYAPGATTSTNFVGTAGPPGGGGLSDGFSGLVKTPSVGGNGFLNLADHTGNPNGLLMLINAPSTAATVFFEYVMDNLCSNTTLKLSIWILNVNSPGTCSGGYQFPNVTLRAVDTVTGNVLGTTTTGNIPINQVWAEYSIVFNNASSSSVRLQIVNNSIGNGCGNDLAIDDITVSPCIPATIRAVPSSGTTLCPGQSSSVSFTATLTGSSYSPAEYQWQLSRDGATTWEDQGQPTTNPNYTFNSAGLPPGNYQLRFKVGPRGSALNSQCNAVSEVSTVIVGSTPRASDATIRSCFIETAPSTATFDLSTADVTSQTGTTKKYYPTLNDARNDTNEIISFTDYVAAHGSVVYVRVTDANGCFAIVKITLEVIPPVKSAILTDKFICIEDTTTLDAGPGFAGYLWSTGATTQSISNIGVGIYQVRLQTGNCFTTQTVRVYASPQPVIQSIDISDHTATIHVTGGKPPYQYSVDGTTNWQDSNIFTKLTRGQHIFYVRDFYDCVPVAVEVTVPNLINAITPNGDHINDVIDYSALAYKNNLVFEVYDRYGNKLHEAGKLRNFSWDGTAYGKKVITGTYWYTISWTESDKNKTQIRYNGWVMVKNRD
ncbi:MAG: gliding motility-associated C-terminal domain-containing protein [Chryseobacterium sp.]|jgi:gliding motility-associated-like protein|uniref:T9SS type B sorting domain-containing protein n=1 Tax=Chryseobacterium sp. TaxID=1871047 RepID=UPI0028270F44|nr:T9SS type B sorting domain-containing protein [Chryseobacterium sp.]MDR2236879.1 gliding motility-associated C-terminal domain-containing protein [Chryseobacterium sp.]